MSLNIEVEATIHYTVNLDDDVKKVKDLLKLKYGDLSECDKQDIVDVVESLYQDGDIDLYADNKANESDFLTESFSWSEFEDKTVEELLGTKEV